MNRTLTQHDFSVEFTCNRCSSGNRTQLQNREADYHFDGSQPSHRVDCYTCGVEHTLVEDIDAYLKMVRGYVNPKKIRWKLEEYSGWAGTIARAEYNILNHMTVLQSTAPEYEVKMDGIHYILADKNCFEQFLASFGYYPKDTKYPGRCLDTAYAVYTAPLGMCTKCIGFGRCRGYSAQIRTYNPRDYARKG